MEQMICTELAVGYDGKPVAEGLNFCIESGDYLCVLGENGAGKSTLMKTLLRLIPPVSGKITYNGMKPNEIGYLPQQTRVQRDFPASVREVVLSGCLNACGWRPFYSREQKARAQRALELMRMDGFANRCYRELSGGQQQRVLLARALCASHKMLLLDEPVAGLDIVATKEMYELISELNREQGVTIIMISHDVAAATERADKILYIGRELFFGTRQQFESEFADKTFGGTYERI